MLKQVTGVGIGVTTTIDMSESVGLESADRHTIQVTFTGSTTGTVAVRGKVGGAASSALIGTITVGSEAILSVNGRFSEISFVPDSLDGTDYNVHMSSTR